MNFKDENNRFVNCNIHPKVASRIRKGFLNSNAVPLHPQVIMDE
jgi:hypothetical protein